MKPPTSLLIQKCASTNSIRKARQLHALILTSANAISEWECPYASNNILSMYARCGSLANSQLVFEKMPQRTVVSYTALISAYSRCPSDAHLAFQLFKRLDNESLRPDGSTFTSLLQASSSLQSFILGSVLHGQCFKFGFLNNVRVQTSLLGLYWNCGDLVLAEKVFQFMVDKDDMAWNSIIYGHIENGKMEKGLRIFSTMAREGVNPDEFTYSMVLNACAKLADYDAGRLVHGHVLVSGICFNLPLYNALLDMYCSCSDTRTGISLFRRIVNPNLFSWNIIIAGYSQNGDGAEAMDMFVRLGREGVIKPDEYTYAAVVSATGVFSASEYGRPLHAQIDKAGIDQSVYVGRALISMYFSNGETESAHDIFCSVVEKNVMLWRDMVAGHFRAGDGESAMKFLQEMLQHGHKIDDYALSIALSACADLATSRQGKMIHSQAVKTGYEFETTVCVSLVDMYAKIGDLQAAEMAFSNVTRPDLRCWNSLLGGYSHHGKADAASEVFDNILKHGLKPDQVTFLSLFAACSHCGLVDKGKFFWNYMKENGLEPGPKHYSCIISLLSRAGLLEEAEEMIIETPFSDDYLELWRTLLNSCVMNENLRIGIHAAKRVLNIDSEDYATNKLLGKLHAIAGRWDSVAETRRKIRKQISMKNPSLSWIEI